MEEERGRQRQRSGEVTLRVWRAKEILPCPFKQMQKKKKPTKAKNQKQNSKSHHSMNQK